MNAIGALTPCGFGDTLVHGDEPMTQPNALACEYQRDYGSARGDLDVSDLINNPEAGGKCRVFGLGLGEESLDFGSDGSAGFQNPPELLEPVPGFPPLRGNPEPTTVLEPTLPEWMPPRATCHRSCPWLDLATGLSWLGYAPVPLGPEKKPLVKWAALWRSARA